MLLEHTILKAMFANTNFLGSWLAAADTKLKIVNRLLQVGNSVGILLNLLTDKDVGTGDKWLK